MARLEKTLQNYQEQLKDKGIKDIPDFIQLILDADITKGKYSRFLLDCYLNDKFREEDLKGGLESTIGISVALFHKHKSKLSKDMRSVYKYDSPGDLWNAVKQFDGQLSGKELKKDEKEKIYAETEFLYEDENTGLKIISPLTEDAAKWWGKGTRWCTSAENNNMFYEYAKESPLLIFLMPGGEKLQLWKHNDDIQFMDEADNKVELDYIKDNICLDFLNNYIPDYFEDFKYDNFDEISLKDCVDERDYIKKILDRKNNFYHLNDCLKNIKMTPELWEFVVECSPELIFCVPEGKKNYNIFKMYIDFIAENEETINFYTRYYNSSLNFIKYIEESDKTFKYLMKVLPVEKYYKYIPNYLKNDAMIEGVLEKNPNLIEYYPEDEKIPYDLFLKYLYHKDVKKVALHLFDNLELKDLSNDVISTMLKKKVPLVYLQDIKLTKELYQIIISSCADYYFEVPEEYKDNIMKEILVKSHPNGIDFLQTHEMTPELVKLAVESNWEALQHIPHQKINLDICCIALNQNIQSYIHIPDYIKKKHDEIFQKIGSNNIDFIDFIKPEFASQEYYNKAVDVDILNIFKVPKKFHNKESVKILFDNTLKNLHLKAEIANDIKPLWNKEWEEYAKNKNYNHYNELKDILKHHNDLSFKNHM